MADKFSDRAGSVVAPATGAFAITPGAADALPHTTRALYVGHAGTLDVTMASGETVTLVDVPAGTVLPLRVVAVGAASAAGALVGFY